MWAILLSASLRFVAAVVVIQLILNIIGTNTYELQAIKRRRSYAQHPHARRLRRRPLISIVLVARDSDQVIEHSLASLLKTSYRNREIIIVDNASQDTTKWVITQFIAEHPDSNLHLFAKRVFSDPMAAALAGYKRYGHGQLVMTLTAGQSLHKQALSQAVRHFNANDNINRVLPKVSVYSAFSALGVLQRYQDLLGYRVQKLNSAFKVSYETERPALYRRPAFLASVRIRQKGGDVSLNDINAWTYYASDAVVYALPPTSFWRLASSNFRQVNSRLSVLYKRRSLLFPLEPKYAKFLTWVRLPLAACVGLAALAAPVLAGYFIYLAVQLQAPTYLVVTCALLSLMLLFAIWDDDQLKLHQKINYSLGIPLTYGFFLLLSIIKAAAIMAIPLQAAANARLVRLTR